MNSNDPDFFSGFYIQLALGNESYAFQEISGISMTMSTEEVAEGGENRFVHRVPTSLKFENLILKRGMVPAQSELVRWVRAAMERSLAEAIQPKELQVSLLNEEGKAAMAWTFHAAFPVQWETAGVNSNEILIESLEFSYTYFDLLGETIA